MPQNLRAKIDMIHEEKERRAMLSIMDSIDNNFGLDFSIEKGYVISLQLAAAGLAVIPRQVKNFSFLRVLDLPANNIKRLRDLEANKSLKILNLSDNDLTTQGIHSINQIQQLEQLNLSMNHIDSMEPLSGLSNLTRLDLSQNNIDEIAYIHLPELNGLNLLGNQIKQLQNLHHYPKLKEINISGKYLPPEEQALLESESMEEILDYCRN